MTVVPFKDIQPGLFRETSGICYTKLPQEVEVAEEKFNAVCITNGKLRYFAETEEVMSY